MNDENCAPPAPSTRGTQAMITLRTPSAAVEKRGTIPPRTRQQDGSCTATWSTLPATVPQASARDRRGRRAGARGPPVGRPPAPPTPAAGPAVVQSGRGAEGKKKKRGGL